jgi:predicted Zn-dependent protease
MNTTTKSRMTFLCLSLLFLASCSQVAITGRKQLNLVPDSLMNSMSYQSYAEFLTENKVSSDTQQVELVRRVGLRIQKAVEIYCAENNRADQLDGYKWEFNLIQDDAVNAWAMPGGKVVVYTGLMSIAQNETGLAVVVAHEIAHVIARHGSERMTQGLLVQFGGMGLSAALQNYPTETQELFMKSYSTGAQYGVLLPYSRAHESESDHMGLIFMAMAGYDPHEAVGFWERMAAAKQDAPAPPEFLSTHPADSTRIRKIKELIPTAMQYYKKP